MPLQQLVEYFNDRLELEHNEGFRPFLLENDTVCGLFGPIKVGTALAPIRETLRTSKVLGYVAQLTVATNPLQTLQSNELDNLVNLQQTVGNSDSVVSFDRLTRTVHMLNYLPQSHLEELLFLHVDPRHILGVKADHGAYFEEIIVKCGLQTANVVITLSVNASYGRFFSSLQKGLKNYQRRGYKLALKFDIQSLENPQLDLISKLAPDFAGLSAGDFFQLKDNQILGKIQHMNRLVVSVGGRSLLLDVDDKHSAALARKSGFDLIHGQYFEIPITTVNKRQADDLSSISDTDQGRLEFS